MEYLTPSVIRLPACDRLFGPCGSTTLKTADPILTCVARTRMDWNFSQSGHWFAPVADRLLVDRLLDEFSYQVWMLIPTLIGLFLPFRASNRPQTRLPHRPSPLPLTYVNRSTLGGWSQPL